MKILSPAIGLLAFIVPLTSAATAEGVVLELYSSQGCSSCPPANDLAGRIADERDDVLVLTWSVDYWNYLGWRDTYSRAEFSDRQEAYNNRLGLMKRFTPQFIINGDLSGSGMAESDVLEALSSATPAPRQSQVEIETADRREITVRITDAPENCQVTIAAYQDMAKVTPRRGENRGKTLHGTNLVTDAVLRPCQTGQMLVDLSDLSFGKATGLAVLLQDGPSGPILASSQRDLQ